VFSHGSCSHTTATAHGSEVAISRFYEPREDCIIFSVSEEYEMTDLLSDKTWCNEVAFLADISQALSTLNKSTQGKNENIITFTDKINSFKENPTMWGARIKNENKVQMFELRKFTDWTKILLI
jgi:hypothetical protein